MRFDPSFDTGHPIDEGLDYLPWRCPLCKMEEMFDCHLRIVNEPDGSPRYLGVATWKRGCLQDEHRSATVCYLDRSNRASAAAPYDDDVKRDLGELGELIDRTVIRIGGLVAGIERRNPSSLGDRQLPSLSPVQRLRLLQARYRR